MNITNDEDRFPTIMSQVNHLARVIDSHAFDVDSFVEEVGKEFHHPKNVYWANRREQALKLAKKIIDAGYSKPVGKEVLLNQI